jgi:hypothetical protein
MSPEERIAAGKSISEALRAFRESLNQLGRMFCTNHWLSPKLEQLQLFLSNPITQNEADALLAVLYKRHWIADLIEWLEEQCPVSWTHTCRHVPTNRMSNALGLGSMAVSIF